MSYDNRAYLYFSPHDYEGRWTITLYSGDIFSRYQTKVKALIDARKFGLVLSDSYKYRIYSDKGVQVYRTAIEFVKAVRKLTNRPYLYGSFDTLIKVNAKHWRCSTPIQPTGWIETEYGTFSESGENLADTIGNGDFIPSI